MHDKQAEIYAKMGWDEHQFANLERLSAIIDLSRIKSSHDVACGTGGFVDRLSRLGIVASGSDLSPAMINQAANSYPHLGFYVGNMVDIRLAEPVDMITINYFSINMVPTQQDIKQAIANLVTNLNPGGYLAFDFSTVGFVHYADIHESYEKNGVTITENIVSRNGICTFDLSWSASDGSQDHEIYTEVTLPVSELMACLESQGMHQVETVAISEDELSVTDYDKLTEGLYVVYKK